MTLRGYLPKDFDVFIGLDVDKKTYVLNIRDHGRMNRLKSMPSNPEILLNYIRKHRQGKRVICAYEAGPTGFRLYDYLTENGIPCLVISPLSMPKAKNETSKTNRIDAKKIAEYLQYGKLRSIEVPIGKYRDLRHLIRIRENYVTMRVKAKQRIKALLLQEALYGSVKDEKNAWTLEYTERLKQLEATDAVRHRLDTLLMDLEYSKVQVQRAHSKLRDFCKLHPEIGEYKTFLKSIPGIGFIIAVTILAKIGDPLRLVNIRQLASFTGMIPWENSTGDTENKGSITHMGNSTLRSLLIEAAWIAIRRDTMLRQFYFRIKGRNHPGCASRKAIVAVARKMTQIIYRILTDKRVYVL
jgi:transposase